jgi:hypothetical protein
MTQTTPAATAPAKPLNIFRPGRHLAMSGQAFEFSESDLQATVAAYNPALHEAPLVVGHPRLDLPAYGWVQALAFSEGGLDATPAQVNTDFADMVAAGAFKKISASFYAPDAPQNPVPGIYYLRHVGFLGAAAPAVKGLRQPSFADDEVGVLTFGEDSLSPTVTPSTTEESTVTKEEAAQLRTQATQQANRIADLEAAAVAATRTTQHAAHTAFCEAQPGVLPAWREVAVATLDHFAVQASPVEFGEGEHKAALADRFKDFLTALPAVVQFGEAATRERAAAEHAAGAAGEAAEEDAQFGESADPERLAQHKAVKAHMAAHKTDYATAARAVIK